MLCVIVTDSDGDPVIKWLNELNGDNETCGVGDAETDIDDTALNDPRLEVDTIKDSEVTGVGVSPGLTDTNDVADGICV